MNPDNDPLASLQTVSAALLAAEQSRIERLDAQWLLADLMAQSRTWLIAHGDSRLDTHQWLAWLNLLERHVNGEPLAYLLGQQTFFGLELQVGPAVLVPRSDTEALVTWAVEILHQRDIERDKPRDQAPPPSVIDLGCGSGAIGLAVKSMHPAAQVTAVDFSSEAIGMAAANGARLGLEIEWVRGDWWAGVGGRRFDLAVSNPPYIAADDPHLTALRHEPTLALVAGDDGLSALREIIAQAPQHLHPQSWLLLEHGYCQADAVTALLHERGFEAVQTRLDLAGRPRCSGGRWPRSAR